MDYGDFEDDAQRIRKALIPKIIDKELRGYIVLPKPWKPTISAIVYSHWNLKEESKYRSPDGKTHLDEVEEELESRGLVKPARSISVRVASRAALYNWLASWGELPDHLTAYDRNGEVIPRSEVQFYTDDMVVEGMEQDMRINIENASDLKDVLKVFKERGHKFKIDDDWDFSNGKMEEEAENAFYFAEAIPLIALFVEEAPKRGFDNVNYTYAKRGKSELGSYVSISNLAASKCFSELGFVPKTVTRLVNRTFSKFIAGIY
ncbi:MAG: hypothetical protein ACE5J7_01060 [Candidatus Aenigmatarchaeota archaeon]